MLLYPSKSKFIASIRNRLSPIYTFVIPFWKGYKFSKYDKDFIGVKNGTRGIRFSLWIPLIVHCLWSRRKKCWWSQTGIWDLYFNEDFGTFFKNLQLFSDASFLNLLKNSSKIVRRRRPHLLGKSKPSLNRGCIQLK